MSNDTKTAFGVLGVFLFIVLLVVAYLHKQESQQNQMKQWAVEHNYTMVGEPKKPWFNAGSPFWFTDDDDDVYWVVMADHDHQKRTCWFRFRAFWGMQQAWKD